MPSPTPPAEPLAARLLTQSPQPVLLLAPDGTVQYANPAARQVLSHLDEGAADWQQLRTAAFAGPAPTQIGLAGRTFLLTAVPDPEGVALYLTDITSQAWEYRELAEEREFFETVLYRLPTGVAIFDAEQRFQYVNPAAIRNDEIRAWVIGKTNFEYCAYRSHPVQMAEQRQYQFERARDTGAEVSWEETFDSPAGPRH